MIMLMMNVNSLFGLYHDDDHHYHQNHHNNHDHNDDDPPALSKLPPQVLPGILLRRQTLGFV